MSPERRVSIMTGVETPRLIYRDEIVSMLFAIADINVNLEKIVHMFEEDDGEEADPEEEP